jgi:tetratricopeptide (TPR) repeat protein
MTDEVYVDLIPDELSLARGQLASGLPGMAEGVLRRHVARLEAGGRGADDELDVARGLLAEALWRQGRPRAAGAIVDAIRAGSMERRRPRVLLVEAEAMAAGGDPDRAAALMERVIEAVGVDEAWRLRGGVPSRLPWPVPPSMRPVARREGGPPGIGGQPRTGAPPGGGPPSPERTAAAHVRLEAARLAYAAGREDEGDRELGLALRMDPRIAADGVALVEPSLGAQPAADRLLLYGDLLRAAGRNPEAAEAYDRAARS